MDESDDRFGGKRDQTVSPKLGHLTCDQTLKNIDKEGQFRLQNWNFYDLEAIIRTPGNRKGIVSYNINQDLSLNNFFAKNSRTISDTYYKESYDYGDTLIEIDLYDHPRGKTWLRTIRMIPTGSKLNEYVVNTKDASSLREEVKVYIRNEYEKLFREGLPDTITVRLKDPRTKQPLSEGFAFIYKTTKNLPNLSRPENYTKRDIRAIRKDGKLVIPADELSNYRIKIFTKSRQMVELNYNRPIEFLFPRKFWGLKVLVSYQGKEPHKREVGSDNSVSLEPGRLTENSANYDRMKERLRDALDKHRPEKKKKEAVIEAILE